MQLTRPELRWVDDPKLALVEAFRMFVTKDANIRPKDTVVNSQPDWERSVMTAYALLNFHLDYAKRPLNMQ